MKTSSLIPYSFLLLTFPVLLAGCETETRGTRVAIDVDAGTASVRENSYRLSNRIKVAKTTYDNDGDIRRATVTLESLTKRRQRIHARMVWLDAEGTEVDPDGKPFRTIVLDGNDTVTFTGRAPNAKAVQAKMVIREEETVE